LKEEIREKKKRRKEGSEVVKKEPWSRKREIKATL
jgi:hypothetical protein